MSLKCQNCGSTDIVTISGQNLCINCGEQVKGEIQSVDKPENKPAVPVAKDVSPEPDAKVEINKTKLEVEKSPSISKFGTQTTPTAANPAPEKSTKAPSVVNPPKKLKIEPQREKVAVASTYSQPVLKPEPTKIDPPAPSKPSLIDKPNDILRPYPKPTPFDGSEGKVKRLKTDSIQPNELKVEDKRGDDKEVKIKPHPFQFTLKIGLPIALLAGVATAATLWFNLDLDLTLYTLSAVAVIVLGYLALAQASLLYGLSRSQDGRPAVQKLWWRAGRGSFLEVINVNIIALITISICVIAGFGVWQAVQQLPAEPIYYRAVAGFLGYAAVTWVALGALSARHVAIPGVVIGSLNSVSATTMGWKAFTRAGCVMVMALVENTFVSFAFILTFFFALIY